MTVYVDLLFMVNMIINTLLLSGATVLARVQSSRFRLLIGATVGALYSVLMFFPEIRALYWVISRLLVGALMVRLALPQPSLRGYLRTVLCFYICLAAYGGGMYLFYSFTAAGAEMVYSNGIYYIDLPMWLLLVLSFVFYGAVRLSALIELKRRPSPLYREAEICCRGKYRTLRALLDTGNSLVDPLTLSPVMVVQSDALQGVLPDDLLQAADKGEAALEDVCRRHRTLKCRLIPFRSVGGESALLLTVRPDWVRLCPDGKMQNNVLLGLSPAALSEDGSYQALLHSSQNL